MHYGNLRRIFKIFGRGKRMTIQQNPTIPDTISGYTRITAKWTRFLSILGFIMAGFMVLFGIFLTLVLTLFPSFFPHTGNTPPPFLGIFYLPMSVLYLVPAIYLFKYSSALKRVLADANIQDIEEAVRYQKSFWKFTGILSLFSLIFAVIGILSAIAIPFIEGFR
jgi:hypothetical protein